LANRASSIKAPLLNSGTSALLAISAKSCGARIAAHQAVIVPCRWPKARALSAVERGAAKPGVERSKPAKANSYGPLPVYLQPDTHPPIRALLKTKGKPKFDSTVDRTVEASFWPFYLVKSMSLNRSFRCCNPLPMHRSAVGYRGSKSTPRKDRRDSNCHRERPA
jgi:hypothetical protein